MKKLTKENIYYIILIAILLVGIITRVIKFGELPIGLNVDEAGIIYDAYCIEEYGTDRFNNSYPVYMINFGGGQSALYTYVTAILFKIFGVSLTVARTPALIFSILFMVFGFLITKDFKNKKLAILVEFLIVIAPWHFMQSRWALDCNLMSSMLLMSIYTLIKAKNKILYFIAGVLFGISLYTYALSYIVIPIILLLLLGYMLYIKKIKISDITVFAIPLAIIATPLILYMLVNMGVLQEIKTPYMSILKMWTFRIGEVNFNNIFQNFINMFKCIFAFDMNNYNAFPTTGTLYYISIPFAIFGFYKSIKNVCQDFKQKKFGLDIVMLINFIAVFICGILIVPGINRINAIYISVIYYTALGILYVSENRKYVLGIIITLYLVFYVMFLYQYLGIYGKQESVVGFNKSAIEVVKYIESNDKFDGKLINPRLRVTQPYIYVIIAKQMTPIEFNEKAVIGESLVYAVDRYIFYNDTISDNIVYVIQDDEEFIHKLISKGFSLEEFEDGISILYKE